MPVLKVKHNGEWINVGSSGSGGGSNINIDSTLTQSGSAADAKASGDAIRNLNTLVGNKSVAEQIQEAIGSGGNTGGSGITVQSDWNQNDETAPNYVKNRTHYDAGHPVEFTIFSGESLVFDEIMDITQTNPAYFHEVEPSKAFAITAGNTYYVTIDGETYTAKSTSIEGISYIGNLNIYIAQMPNTGEPFFITNMESSIIALNITGETHNITISEIKNVVEKEIIPDNEYTFSVMNPDMIPTLINIGSFDLSSMSEGDFYNVTFDSVEYQNTVKNMNGTLVFGNLGLIGIDEEDTGEPYLALYAEGMSGMYAVTTSIQAKFSIDKVLADGTYETVVPEGTRELVYMDGGYLLLDVESGYILEANTTYKITWNDIEYTCVSIDQNIGSDEEPMIAVYAGNLSKISTSATDTGEPFIFYYAPNEDFITIFIPDASFTDTHQIKVTGYVSGVKKLDKKYLPNDIDIPVASNNKIGGVKVRNTYSGLRNSNDYTPIYLDTDDNQIYAKARSSMSTLTFTGATSGSYNGSNPVTINIPRGVPTVSTSDNGKVLGVVNGSWAKYDLPVQEIKPLTFTGLVEGTYDGTAPLTINIPIVRNSIVFLDQTTGEDYSVYVDNGQIVCKAVSEVLTDFDYTRNNDGTYTINSWKGTLNGETSTECVVPSTIVTIVE